VELSLTARHWPIYLRLREHLRGIPFFYRVLAGNCLVVVLGAVVGTYLTILFARQEPNVSPLWLVASFGLVGTALSLIVNYLVLRAAFRPLRPPCATPCCRSSRSLSMPCWRRWSMTASSSRPSPRR
jgi:hypothetical protein